MEFEVIRSNRKTLAMEIKGTKLIFRAPLWATKETIQAFLSEHKGRIALLSMNCATGRK